MKDDAEEMGIKYQAGVYLPFASDGGGNHLVFDLSTLTTDGDCKVLEWCHDPLSISREWPGIIQLLEESILLEETTNSAKSP